MGWWQVSAYTLAGSRFALSPLAETFACRSVLYYRTAAGDVLVGAQEAGA